MKKAFIVVFLITAFVACHTPEVEDPHLFEGVVCDFISKQPLPDSKVAMIRIFYNPSTKAYEDMVYDTIQTDWEGKYGLNFNSRQLGNNRLYFMASADEGYSNGNIKIAKSTEDVSTNIPNIKRIIFSSANFDTVYIDKTAQLLLNFKNVAPAHKKSIVASIALKEFRGNNNKIVDSEIEIFKSSSTAAGEISVLLELMHGLNPSVVLKYRVEKELMNEAEDEGEQEPIAAPPIEEEITIDLIPHEIVSEEIEY